MQRKQKLKEFVLDKGYYLALGVCVVAVAVSGWLFVRSLDVPDGEVAVPDAVEAAVMPTLPRLQNPVRESLRPGKGEKPQTPGAGTVRPETEPVRETAPIRETAPEAEEPADAETAPAPARPMARPGVLTCLPLEGETVSSCALDRLTFNPTTRDWRTHDGIDLAAPEGSPVCAAGEGTVLAVYDDELLGRTVTLEHGDGLVTRYANLAEEVSVSAGDHVGAGDRIGAVGRTALAELSEVPHLHFSAARNDVPVDPAELLP